MLLSSNANAQFFKELYNDFLKYGTVLYAAGNIENAKSEVPKYFIRTDPQDFYGIPEVDRSEQYYHPLIIDMVLVYVS
jgi:hypothetical protein